jgi:hypothetical protein
MQRGFGAIRFVFTERAKFIPLPQRVSTIFLQEYRPPHWTYPHLTQMRRTPQTARVNIKGPHKQACYAPKASSKTPEVPTLSKMSSAVTLHKKQTQQFNKVAKVKRLIHASAREHYALRLN